MLDGRMIPSTTQERVDGRVEATLERALVDGKTTRSMLEQLDGRPMRGRVPQKVAGIPTTKQ